jgi:hypothetical protein
MNLPIYDLIINNDEDNDAEVSFVALVDSPAIKKDFLAFSAESELIKFAIQSESEHIITGALMIPQQLIYRNSEQFGEHYVKFSVETIKQIAIKFSKKGYQKNVNIMHEADMQVEGVTMFESFISDSKRGIKPMEAFKDLPDGTWFGSFYVENPKVWELVKSGEVKGFSVEGMFDYEAPQKQMSEDEKQLAELREILNSF